MNSFIVFIDSSIESNTIEKEINKLDVNDRMILSSVFFSFFFFIFDTMIILYFKKEKIIIEVLLIVFFLLFLFIVKQTRIKKLLVLNHVLFDLIMFFRPFFWYFVYTNI